MEIKLNIKIILLLIAFQACAIARYETINEEELCTAAKFIMAEDDQRQSEFNINPVSVDGKQSYRQHTIAINTKINKGVNTEKKASKATKHAVTLAILGTAFTEFGENTDLTQKFHTVKRDLKTSSPDTYKTDTTYLHYAALHTIEVLANSLVKGALDTADAGINTHFRNLTFLTGIKRDAFMELFGMAQLAHQAGLDTRKNPSNHVASHVSGSEEDAMELDTSNTSISTTYHIPNETSAVLMDVTHTKVEEKNGDDVVEIIDDATVSSTTQREEGNFKSKLLAKSTSITVASEYNWTEVFVLSDGREVKREPGKITVTSYSNKGNKKFDCRYIDIFKIEGKAAHTITIPVQSTREEFIRLLEQTKLYGQTTSAPKRTINRRASTGSTSSDSGRGVSIETKKNDTKKEDCTCTIC